MGLPFPRLDVPAKSVEAKRLAYAPAAQPASTIAPPPAPAAAAPRVRRPAGHLDPVSLAALGGGAVPQVPDPRALYDRARDDAPADVENGVMVCSVRLTRGGYDDGLFAGGADVYMTLRIGDGASRSTHQTSRRIYSFPLARLEADDRVRIRVLDDDVFRDDLIGTGNAHWSGGSLFFETDGADVSCRVAHGDAVERPLARALRRVDRQLERVEGAEPDVAAYDLGYPTERAAGVRGALREALAWVQPGDDEIADRVDRAGEVEEAWEDAASDAVDDAVATLPPPGEAVPLRRLGTVRAGALACDGDAARMRDELERHLDPSAGCLLRVEIATRRGGTLPSAGAGALEVWGVDRAATMIPLQQVGVQRGTEWLDPASRAQPISYGPGETIAAVYAVPVGTRPALLRAGRDGRAVVLRLE